MPTFTGGPSADTLSGGAENDTVTGAAGDDILNGGGADDVLIGNAGADTLSGDGGNDALYAGDKTTPWNTPYFGITYVAPLLDTGLEVDTLTGGAGGDLLFGGYGDNIDGGNDDDSLAISFAAAPTGVTLDMRLATQTIGGGVISSIENLLWAEGSDFNDEITASGGYGNSVMFGRGGDDRLTAGYYSYGLYGGDGNDYLDARLSQYMVQIEGGAGNDTIYSSGSPNVGVEGGDGDDTITGNGRIRGGAGNDHITLSSSGYDTKASGDAGDDVIQGASSSANVIQGGDGADTLTGGSNFDILSSGKMTNLEGPVLADMGLEHDDLLGLDGVDILAIGYGDDADGGAGADILYLSLGGMTTGITLDTSTLITGQPYTLGGGTFRNMESLGRLWGTEFADILTIASQANPLTVDAGGGDDVITSQYSSALIIGGAGDDRFIGGLAADNFDGGDGSDTIDYASNTSGVTVNLNNGAGAGGDVLTSVENVIGTAFDDVFTASTSANRFVGGAGIDRVSYATALGVTVSLALTTAQATGSSGSDTLLGIENLTGSDYDDVLGGDAGDNILDGGGGADRVSYAAATGGVTVNLSVTTAQNTVGAGTDTLISIEGVIGSNGNDTLTGSAGANLMEGLGGNDTLDGGAGIDTLSYASSTAGVRVYLNLTTAQDTLGAGVDTVTGFENLTGSAFNDILGGTSGNNTLNGGAGIDMLTYEYATSGVFVWLASTTNSTNGAGMDSITGFENLTGSLFNDSLQGNDFDNVVYGLAGDDGLFGWQGHDTLIGGDGADWLNGGLGAFNDTLIGGLGRDIAISNVHSTLATVTHNNDGSWTVSSTADGTDTLSGIEVLQFGDRSMALSNTLDFNADGIADLLWRNSNGMVDGWLTTRGDDYDFTDANQGVIDTAWTIAQQGDFNGDGKNDLLWRHSSGNTNVWLSNAGSGMTGFTGQGLGDISTAWKIQQTGDFNGDGKNDVVWRHDNGTVNIWASNSGAGYTGFTGEGFGAIDNAWTIKGAGDFNGDGRADMLWRHTSGAVNIWLSNTTSGPIGFTGDNLGVIPTNWTIQGTGDFNGDGKADILWRNSAGSVNLWLSNMGTGFTGLTGVDLGGIPADWVISKVGDFNGDAKADIAWRHADGSVNLWMSNTGNGFTGLTGQYVGAVSNDWFIV